MDDQQPSNSRPDDLELAQRLLELTAFIQKNSKAIEDLRTEISKLNSKTQNFDLELGKKFAEFRDNLNSDIKRIDDKFDSHINEIKETLKTQKDHLASEMKTVIEVIETQEERARERWREEDRAIRNRRYKGIAEDELRPTVRQKKREYERVLRERGRLESEAGGREDIREELLEALEAFEEDVA